MNHDKAVGPETLSPKLALVWTTSVAILAGAGEVAVWMWRRLVLLQPIGANWQIVWLTPLAYAVLLLPVALLLAAGLRYWRRLFTTTASVFLNIFIAAFGILFLFHPKLHLAAVALLAAGVATQAARLARNRFSRVLAVSRRAAAVVALGVVAYAVVLNAGQRLIERRALTSNRPVAPGAPNVLLIVLDTVRASNLGLYGYDRDTSPALDALALGGVTFAHAFSTAPWTLPSHATLFTGRYAREQSTGWTSPLDNRDPTLAEVFVEHGYATGGFVGNVDYVSRERGVARGFMHFEDYLIEPSALIVNSSLGRFVNNSPTVRQAVGYYDILGRKTAGEVRVSLLQWLDRIGSRPFFAFVNFYDAHEPYLPPPPFDRMFGPVGFRNLGEIRQMDMNVARRRAKPQMTAPERIEERRAYDQSIAAMIAELGSLLKALEAQGRLQNTIVVVTADHGELLGEHDLFDHGNSLYLPLLQVPLVIVYPPRLPAHTIRDEPVTLRDLPATILDLAGLTNQQRLPGEVLFGRRGEAAASRSPILADVDPAPLQDERYPSAKGPMRSIISGSLHYIRNGDGREELYDWRADPAESRNLAGVTTVSTLSNLRGLLEAHGARRR